MYGMVQLKTYLVCGSCGLGMRSLMMTTGCSRSNERLFVGRAGFTSLLRGKFTLKSIIFFKDSQTLISHPLTHFTHSHTPCTPHWQTLAYFVLPKNLAYFALPQNLAYFVLPQNLAYFVLPQGYLSIWRPPLLSSYSLSSLKLSETINLKLFSS